jgi:hypothetical protein
MMSDEYTPDFIERNGTWVLSVLAVLVGCGGTLLAFCLKSRCRNIKCCGAECDRDVLAIDPKSIEIQPVSAVTSAAVS